VVISGSGLSGSFCGKYQHRPIYVLCGAHGFASLCMGLKLVGRHWHIGIYRHIHRRWASSTAQHRREHGLVAASMRVMALASVLDAGQQNTRTTHGGTQ
jgi:hypothetical protein